MTDNPARVHHCAVDFLRQNRFPGRETFESSGAVDPDSVSFDKGEVTGVGYHLRAQTADTAPDSLGQKMDAESFRETVGNEAHQGRSKWIWGHGMKQSEGLCQSGTRDDDLTIGKLRFELTEPDLMYHAKSDVLPREDGNWMQVLMWSRFTKMKSGAVGENSIGLSRDWDSAVIRGPKREDDETQADDEGVSVVHRQDADGVTTVHRQLDNGIVERDFDGWDFADDEWLWSKVAQLWECSPVTWGVDPKTPIRSIQAGDVVMNSLRMGSIPGWNEPVAYQDDDGKVRFALVESSGLLRRTGTQVLLSDIETGRLLMRHASDLVPCSTAARKRHNLAMNPPPPEPPPAPAQPEQQAAPKPFDYSAVGAALAKAQAFES